MKWEYLNYKFDIVKTGYHHNSSIWIYMSNENVAVNQEIFDKVEEAVITTAGTNCRVEQLSKIGWETTHENFIYSSTILFKNLNRFYTYKSIHSYSQNQPYFWTICASLKVLLVVQIFIYQKQK